MHAHQAGHEQRMSEAADRKQLGHALQDAKKNQKPQSHASILFRCGLRTRRAILVSRLMVHRPRRAGGRNDQTANTSMKK
jgi:hypothetical protein